MSNFLIKFSGWLLLLLMAMIVFEIVCVGVFAAGWCLHSIFGHYAVLMVAVLALISAWFHERHEIRAGHRGPFNENGFAAH